MGNEDRCKRNLVAGGQHTGLPKGGGNYHNSLLGIRIIDRGDLSGDWWGETAGFTSSRRKSRPSPGL